MNYEYDPEVVWKRINERKENERKQIRKWFMVQEIEYKKKQTRNLQLMTIAFIPFSILSVLAINNKRFHGQWFI